MSSRPAQIRISVHVCNLLTDREIAEEVAALIRRSSFWSGMYPEALVIVESVDGRYAVEVADGPDVLGAE